MRSLRILASLALLIVVPAVASPNDAERPIDSSDVALYEKIIDTLEHGGKVCQREMVQLPTSHMWRRPCVEGSNLSAEEWGHVYENLRMLKACVASAKPCKRKAKAKDHTPTSRRKIPVYNN